MAFEPLSKEELAGLQEVQPDVPKSSGFELLSQDEIRKAFPQGVPSENLQESLSRSVMMAPQAQGGAPSFLGIPPVGPNRSREFEVSNIDPLQAAREEAFSSQFPISSSIVDASRPSLNLLGGLAGSTPLTAAVLTPGAQSVSDLIVGLLGDVRSPEVQALSQRTLPEYLKQRGTEAVVAAGSAKLGEVLPGLISGGYRRVARIGARPEVLQQAEKAAELGIDLPVGSATGAPLLTGSQAIMAKAPFTKGAVADAFENAAKQLDAATESQLGKLGPSLSEGAAGNQVGETLKAAHQAGLQANDINYRAIPQTFADPLKEFPLSKQQSRSLELLEEYTKASPANQNKSVVARLRQASGTDQNISSEIIDQLDEKTKAELVNKFVPKKDVTGSIESLSPESRRVYDLTPDSRKPQILSQMLGPQQQVPISESVNQLVGKPVSEIINRLSPEARKNVLKTVTPKFDWDTLTLRERAGLNEEINRLKADEKFTDAKFLENLIQPLRQDMRDIAKSQGPDAEEAFKVADQGYQEFARIFQDSPKIVKLLSATEPEAIRRLVTGKEAVGFITDFKKAVGPDSPAFNTIRRKYAEDFLAGSDVGQDTLKAVFSPEEFKGISEFKKTADFVKDQFPGKIPDSFFMQRPALISVGLGGVGYFAGGVPGAVGAAISPNIMARALLTPSGRALILEGARTPTKSAKAAKVATRLAALFAGEEAVAPEEPSNLQDFISGKVKPQ